MLCALKFLAHNQRRSNRIPAGDSSVQRSGELLDSAGIDSDLTAAALVQDVFPGLGGTIILVREEDADAARKLIDEYRQPAAADDAAAEVEASEEPQQ